MKKISPQIKLKIIELSKCFWYWNSFYSFYSSVLGISKRKLEIKFPKDSYNKYSATETILEELEENNQTDKIKEIISNFYKLDKPFDKNDNPKYNEALQDLKAFKENVGKDIIEEEIQKRDFEKNLEKQRKEDLIEKERRNKIEKIKNEFYDFSKVTEQRKKQERGYWLEKNFYELLELENIEHGKPYKNKNEQIDGHLKFKSFDYLVETKWTESQVKQKDISIFEGKLATKGQSTRGFILSISGFDDSAIQSAQNGTPRIIFMDAVEFISILELRCKLYDILLTKENNLVKFGKVYK